MSLGMSELELAFQILQRMWEGVPLLIYSLNITWNVSFKNIYLLHEIKPITDSSLIDRLLSSMIIIFTVQAPSVPRG